MKSNPHYNEFPLRLPQSVLDDIMRRSREMKIDPNTFVTGILVEKLVQLEKVFGVVGK
jgi:hypothetical protein